MILQRAHMIEEFKIIAHMLLIMAGLAGIGIMEWLCMCSLVEVIHNWNKCDR